MVQPLGTQEQSAPGKTRRALIVLGMHRSGTSALTRTLNLLGVPLPPDLTRPIEGNNPLGFWESEAVNTVNQRLCRVAFGGWDSPLAAWDGWLEHPDAGVSLREIRRLLGTELATSDDFLLKDPRLCRLLPVWYPHFAAAGVEPHFVIPLRNPLDIIASLKKRNDFSTEHAAMLTLRHMVDALRHSAGRQRVFVTFDSLLEHGAPMVADIMQTLGFTPDADPAVREQANAFLDPAHRHHATPLEVLYNDTAALPGLREVTRLMAAAAAAPDNAFDQDAFETAAAPFERLLAPLSDKALVMRSAAVDITRRTTTEGLALRDAKLAEDAESLRQLDRRLRHVEQQEMRLDQRLAAASMAAGGSTDMAALSASGEEKACQRDPAVSVIMPTWNRKLVLARAIRSALAQTMQDFEIIVVDDGSIDGTDSHLALQFADAISSGRLRYFKRPHLGVSAARNKGLEAARGEFIAYLDSDNAWFPEYLAEMVGALRANPLEHAAYAGQLTINRVNGQVQPHRVPFDRTRLLDRNFMDMNVFMHRRDLIALVGGFNETLTRLVDWELILRMTKLRAPLEVPQILAAYYQEGGARHITLDQSFHDNLFKVRCLNAQEMQARGLTDWMRDLNVIEPMMDVRSPAALAAYQQMPVLPADPGEETALRLAVVLWDFPALTQTFVMNELRWLKAHGEDVIVYFKTAPEAAATLDFEIEAHQVEDATQLARFLAFHQRTHVHAHFVYPAGTTLAAPAAAAAGLPFTMQAYAVDIFTRNAQARNFIGIWSGSGHCRRIFTSGKYHRQFLIQQGVSRERIAILPQTVAAPAAAGPEAIARRMGRRPRRIITIARFIEKKGIEYLILAATHLRDMDIEILIYGYGDREPLYRDLIARNGLEDRVILAGSLPDKTSLNAAYDDADVYAAPGVQAENGDMDGIPTVLVEAMMKGLPVVTSSLSSVPDLVRHEVTGFLSRPGDPGDLATSLRHVLTMDRGALGAMLEAAQDQVRVMFDQDRNMRTYKRFWARQGVDIVLVTFNRAGYDTTTETFDIIRRVQELTETPFRLIIVDNASDPAFVQDLRDLADRDRRIDLVTLEDNIYCGPASNMGIERGTSPYVIYLCSKEGFPLQPGWERPLIDHMEVNSDVAMGGTLASSPAWSDGRGYMARDDFGRFRNPGFAQAHPDRPFRHVQGGAYILRRSAYEQVGGFNPQTPHNGMDVEYSYYLESTGWQISAITGVDALTTKTLPTLDARLDENTLVAHPLTAATAMQADTIATGTTCKCTVCGWHGASLNRTPQGGFLCPQCGSTGTSRVAMRWLADSDLPYRGRGCIAVLPDLSLQKPLESMFSPLGGCAGPIGDAQTMTLQTLLAGADGLILLLAGGQGDALAGPWLLARRRIAAGLAVAVLDQATAQALGETAFDGLHCARFTPRSTAVRYDLRGLVIVTGRPTAPENHSPRA